MKMNTTKPKCLRKSQCSFKGSFYIAFNTKLSYNKDYKRVEDYAPITENDSKKLSYAFERELLPIESNIEKITELESKVYDYIEYE